jgi:hypothetical protein
LGHSSDAVYQKYYQSDVSAVDIKGIVLRRKADGGFDTLALRRNRRLKRLPSRLPSRAHQNFLESWKRMTWDKEATRDVCGKRARTAAWNELKQSWGLPFITLTASEPPLASSIHSSVEHLGDLDDPETKSAIMMRYDGHRMIARECANSDYSLRTSPVFDSLVCLAGREYHHPAAWYPGTEPVQKADVGILECRFCRLDLTR